MIRSEDSPEYKAETVDEHSLRIENEIIAKATDILRKRVMKTGFTTTCPEDTSNFLIMTYAGQEHETFDVMLLDNKHQMIKFERLFRGTIDGASVYPREVVKTVLQYNAAAVIFSHNHPSGNAEPSNADKLITDRLVQALKLIDVRVLDHIVVGGTSHISFAEEGYI